MADDILSKFTGRLRQSPAPAPASHAVAPPALVVNHAAHGRQAYEAYEPFINEVRATNVEIICHRVGLSYFVPYAHMGVIVFRFRAGDQIFFTGGGYAVEITGRNLRAIVLALRLHTCGTIQDFDPNIFILPQPVDATAPFVESVRVEVLHGSSRSDESR